MKWRGRVVVKVCLAAAFAALVGVGFAKLAVADRGRSQSPGGASPLGSRLSPFAFDPYGAENPYLTFERWRRRNRVTLPASRAVIEAHKRWLELHPSAAPTPSALAHGVPRSAPQAAFTVGTNTDLGDVATYQGEVAIAVNPANPKQLVAAANTFYGDPNCPTPNGTTNGGTQALYGSVDGGSTWSYVCAPWPAGATGGGTGSSYYDFGSDPTVAWDAAGNAYVAYMLLNQNGSGSVTSSSIVVAKSTNSGTSRSPWGIVINDLANSSLFDDKEMLAIDTSSGGAHSHTNRAYVIWDQNNTEMVAYSDNGTFSAPVIVEAPSYQGSNIGGDLAIGADGTVYAVWNRLLASIRK